MIVLSKSVRIVAFTKPVTFQMHIDGLVSLVRHVLGEDPFSGSLFCFFSIHRARVKLVVWDHNGFWVLSKRLERGTFQSLDQSQPGLELTREELVMLLAGVDRKTRRSQRNFSRETPMTQRDDGDRSAHSAR